MITLFKTKYKPIQVKHDLIIIFRKKWWQVDWHQDEYRCRIFGSGEKELALQYCKDLMD